MRTLRSSFLRVGMTVVTLLLLPVSVHLLKASDSSLRLDVGSNNACASGVCCFQIGEICNFGPMPLDNHKYFSRSCW